MKELLIAFVIDIFLLAVLKKGILFIGNEKLVIISSILYGLCYIVAMGLLAGIIIMAIMLYV